MSQTPGTRGGQAISWNVWPAASQSQRPVSRAQQLVDGDVDEEGGLHDGRALREGPVQRLCLRARAREAVEDDPAGGVGGGEALEEHPHGHLVGNQLASLHVGLRGEPQGRPVARGGPEEVARGHARQGQVLGQDAGLRSLARPGSAQEHEDPHRSADPDPSRLTG